MLLDGVSFLLLAAVVGVIVPRTPKAQETGGPPVSGWTAMRSVPGAAGLFVVTCLFDLFYMPVEIALPLFVRDTMGAPSGVLGLLWSAMGVGAVVGGLLTNWLRRVPRHVLLVGIIGAWGTSAVLLAVAPSVPVAVIVCAVGGCAWAPFTPVVYTYVLSMCAGERQPAVLTLWTTGATLAAPIGLLAGGPLVATAGVRGGLLVCATLTLLLVPAAIGILRGTGSPPQARNSCFSSL